LSCSQSGGDHPEINLAKFGYMLKYASRNILKTDSFYVLGYLITGNYHKNLANLGHFFIHEKLIHIS